MSQGPNLHAYVKNDPANLVDPEGKGFLDWFEPFKRLWEPSKCARIAAKWKTNCFDKIPNCGDCGPPQSATHQEFADALEKYTECIGQRQQKWRECLDGMNRELNEAHCATSSL
jgi:hypothetical protein